MARRRISKISADSIRGYADAARGVSFERRTQAARKLDAVADSGRFNHQFYLQRGDGSRRSLNGQFMSGADKNRVKTFARLVRHNSSLRGNDYKYGTRDEVKAQHNSRYRNIRRSFGMSAG